MAWQRQAFRLMVPILATGWLAGCGSTSAPTAPVPPVIATPTPPQTALTVPAIAREFRGLWIATVANIDWPSRSDLTVNAQQGELGLILDVAQNAGLNAVVLQVRAAGDALYASPHEPWARVLTGTQGTNPGYDPLAYAVTQARLRGLEVHAWFNPFRAANLADTSRLAPQHFAKRRPDLTRPYCTQLFFDPAEPDVRDQAILVMLDVLRRYDIDAVHMDDFFYPYPDTRCPGLDFPDSAGYARYRGAGGALTRGDWRRDNVNRFVERLYREVRAVSPTARVGISPFGIWRPGNPVGITGLDAYASIYADSRLWLQRGWVDYLAPQLYWSLASIGQNFTSLISWWGLQNTQRRHLWPGLASYRVNDGSASPYVASEIPAQIQVARGQAALAGGATGVVLYNTTSVRTNRGGLTTLLSEGVFATPAIPPASPWLDAVSPAAPTFAVSAAAGVLQVTMTPGRDDTLSWWLVRWRVNGTWRQRQVLASTRTFDVPAAGVDGIVVNAIDRTGNASADVIWRPQ